MTDTIKNATLSNPSAATETTLYQVPSSTKAVIGGVFIANRNASSRVVKVKITDSANTLAAQIIVSYTLAAADTIRVPGPINLENQQKLRVESSGADVDFSAAVLEVT